MIGGCASNPRGLALEIVKPCWPMDRDVCLNLLGRAYHHRDRDMQNINLEPIQVESKIEMKGGLWHLP